MQWFDEYICKMLVNHISIWHNILMHHCHDHKMSNKTKCTLWHDLHMWLLTARVSFWKYLHFNCKKCFFLRICSCIILQVSNETHLLQNYSVSSLQLLKKKGKKKDLYVFGNGFSDLVPSKRWINTTGRKINDIVTVALALSPAILFELYCWIIIRYFR